MKNTIRVLISIAVLSAVLVSSFVIFNSFFLNRTEKNYNTPIKVDLNGQPLPDFSFFSPTDSTRLNVLNGRGGRPIVVLYFDPFCPFCMNQIKDLIDSYDKLEGIDFLFISPSQPDQVMKTYNEYNLKAYSNIRLGIDDQLTFLKHFSISKFPTMMLYDGNRRLIGVFEGVVSHGQILSYFKQ